MANGDELPGLLDALDEFIRKNRDPDTGLVLGATVREPTEEHTVKTYAFICDDERRPFYVFVWQFGNVNVGKADFTKGLHIADSEIFYNEEFEFDDVASVIAKVESFLRESAALAANAPVAAPVAS